MATSGPITYLVMADQFPSDAAPRERLPHSTGMSGPLIGMRRETGWAGGGARERPVFLAGQPADRRQSWAPATWRTGHVLVPVPVVLPGRRQSLAADRAGARRGPVPGGPGRLALAVTWLPPGRRSWPKIFASGVHSGIAGSKHQ